MATVKVHIAQKPGNFASDIEPTTIKIELPIPEDQPFSFSPELDGKKVADALWRALPGATIDQVLINLLRKRASKLHVSMSSQRSA